MRICEDEALIPLDLVYVNNKGDVTNIVNDPTEGKVMLDIIERIHDKYVLEQLHHNTDGPIYYFTTIFCYMDLLSKIKINKYVDKLVKKTKEAKKTTPV